MAKYCPVCNKTTSWHMATHCDCDGHMNTLVPIPQQQAAQPVKAQPNVCAGCGGNHPTYDADGQPCANLMEGGRFNGPASLKSFARA